MFKSCLAPSLGDSVTAWTFAKRDPPLRLETESRPLSPGAALERPSLSVSLCLPLSLSLSLFLSFFVSKPIHHCFSCFYPGPEEDFLISTVIKSKKNLTETLWRHALIPHSDAIIPPSKRDRLDGLNMPLYNEKS